MEREQPNLVKTKSLQFCEAVITAPGGRHLGKKSECLNKHAKVYSCFFV